MVMKNVIKNRIRGFLHLTAYALLPLMGGWVGVSCSDEWNDHYDAYSPAEDSGSLWEAVSGEPQLSHFASVVKACGYDRILSSNQTFTVFAPTNDTFSANQAEALIDSYNQQNAKGVRTNENTVIRRFLQNHIAQYRYPVSSLTEKTISMMNNKYAQITTDKIGNRTFTSKNALSTNGLLFTIDGTIDYVPSVFESLNVEAHLDSVYRFLNSHSVYVFDETQSVPGEIIDGVTHYLDSVTVFNNDLLQKYGLINSEDSSYIMVAPVNDEWNRLVAEYEPYFNYANNVPYRDSLAYTNTRLAILGGAFFSRTNNSDAALQDSAVSTQAYSQLMRQMLGIDENYYVFKAPYAEGGIFDDTQTIVCSNGQMLKASSFNIPKTMTFMQNVKVEAENSQYQDTLINAVEPVTVRQVESNNPFYGQVSGNAFIEVVPSTPSGKVIIGFQIPNLLSDVKYDIYAVFAPATAADTLDVEGTTQEVKVISRLRQTDQNGMMTTPSFRYPKTIDGTAVCEVKLLSGQKLTTCSYDLSTPNARLEIQSNTEGATLRIDRIIFKPVE